MTAPTLQTMCLALHLTLDASASPVERDIASMLGGTSNDRATAFRLRRYQRKVDVAHRVMTAYDDSIDKPIGTQSLSKEGYVGLAMVFVKAAWREAGTDETSRAMQLRWTNSAANALDCANAAGCDWANLAFDTALESLLQEGVAH